MEQDVAAAGIFEVERDGLLARVEHQEAVVGAVFGRRAFAQNFAGSGRLDLDDFGPEMGELETAVGTRVNLGEFDDAITVQWQTHASSLSPSSFRFLRNFAFEPMVDGETVVGDR